jgi:uncharacterized protein YvpB
MMTYVKRVVTLALCVALIAPFEMAYADVASFDSPEPATSSDANAAPSLPPDAPGAPGASDTISEPSSDAPPSADPPSPAADELPAVDENASEGGDAASADPSSEVFPQDSTENPLPLEPATYLIRPASSADKVIDIYGSSEADNAGAILFRSHLRANQRFAFTADASGVYTITNVFSGKVLDVEAARKAGGAKVIQYHKTDGANQQWTLQKNEDGSYVITSVLDTSFVLDVSGSSDKNGAEIIIWRRRANAANQSFFLIPVQSTTPQAGNVSFADGAYFIQDSLSPVRTLDITGNSTAQDAQVILWDENGGQNQKFVLTRDVLGLYAIRPLHSGKALGVLPPSRELVHSPYLSAHSDDISYLSQRWVLSTEESAEAGASASVVRITNAATGLVLDVTGASPKAGTALITYPDKNTNNQRFTLQQVATNNPKAGIYTLAPQSAPSKRVDITGASSSAGASAIIWDAHGGQNQKFQRESTGDGAYVLMSLASGKRLTDVSGAVVQMSASSADDQKWELQEVFGAITLKNRASERYLTCVDAKNLTTSVISSAADLFSVSAANLFVFASAPAINTGYYFIATQANGNRVLDVYGASISAGANVLLWDKKDKANQIWLVTQNADGSYWISSALSSMRLDVEGSSKQSGANVLQYTPHNNANQKWRIVPADDGSFYLRSALGADLTLGAENGSVAQGSNIAVYTADSSVSQRFSFIATQNITQVRLDVPLLLQLPSYPTGCEAAAVAMMLRYAGYNVSVATIVNAMPYHGSNPNLGFVGNPRTWSGYTIYPPALLGVVRSYAGSAVDLTGASLDDFKTYLKAGKPIACWIRYGSGLHCVTITGFDAQNFYYNDPYGGKDKAVSHADLTAIRAPLGYRALSY